MSALIRASLSTPHNLISSAASSQNNHGLFQNSRKCDSVARLYGAINNWRQHFASLLYFRDVNLICRNKNKEFN